MVAGFMLLLKIAVITGALGQASVVPFDGVTEVTVGAASGVPAATAFPSGSPHPAVKLSSRSAINQIPCLRSIRIQTISPALPPPYL